MSTDFTVGKIHEAITIFPTRPTWDVLINICVRTELGQEWNRVLDRLWYLCSSAVHYNYHIFYILHGSFKSTKMSQSPALKWSDLPSWESVGVLPIMKKYKLAILLEWTIFSHWGWNDDAVPRNRIGMHLLTWWSNSAVRSVWTGNFSSLANS